MAFCYVMQHILSQNTVGVTGYYRVPSVSVGVVLVSHELVGLTELSMDQ